MTKTLIILATFFSLSAAQADNFYCQIQSSYGFLRAETEAQYGVKHAVTEDGEFKCEGLVNGQETRVRVTSLITGESNMVSERASKASVEMTAVSAHGDTLESVICTCGAR